MGERSPRVCEVERSMTTATMSFTFSRSSCTSAGLASARRTRPRATARRMATGPRVTSARMARRATTAPRAQRAKSGTRGEKLTESKGTLPLLPETFEQGRHVHLVGLVVAGQRIHDDVDAAAIRELPLALVAANDRIEPLTARSHG